MNVPLSVEAKYGELVSSLSAKDLYSFVCNVTHLARFVSSRICLRREFAVWCGRWRLGVWAPMVSTAERCYLEPLEQWCVEMGLLRARYEELRSEYFGRPAASLLMEEGGSLLSPGWRNGRREQEVRESEEVIRKDCTRTFSHLLFFKSSAVQDLIVRLLLVFAFSHPDIGYKQGMTDLLGVLLLCLYCDRWRLGGKESSGVGEECCGGSFPQRTQDVLDGHLRFQGKVYRQEAETFRSTLSQSQRKTLACLQVLTSSDYLEHDCFSLLEAVFAPLRGCYVSETADSTLESRMDRVMLLVRSWDPALGSHLDVFL